MLHLDTEAAALEGRTEKCPNVAQHRSLSWPPEANMRHVGFSVIVVVIYRYLGRVYPVVHKYTTIFICICRLNTTFYNDIIGDRFRS